MGRRGKGDGQRVDEVDTEAQASVMGVLTGRIFGLASGPLIGWVGGTKVWVDQKSQYEKYVKQLFR